MKIKFFGALACLALISAGAMAQTQYETARLTGSELNGTARFVGMGGAMGALGADISTMNTNPAGVGLYRSSEISTSFGFNNTQTKSGTYDIEDGYDNREIVCEVSFVGNDYLYPGVRARARAVAAWLSGEGLLVFDDEPEKAYSAKVIEGVSIEQIAVTGHCEVVFSCSPFAESLEYNQQSVSSVSLPHTETVTVNGTQETDCLVYITARGRIQNLTVTRIKVN